MRGLDSQGNAANFIETEQILEYKNMLCSFVQTRGSIPLFWSQNPNLAWQPFPKIAASLDHVRAFRLHIESHLFNYGKLVLVNLV